MTTTSPSVSAHARVLDLSSIGVRDHWAAQGVSRLIDSMERCEPWAVDARSEIKAQAEELVAKVSQSFNLASVDRVTSSVTVDPAVTIEFMGYLRSGRALALFAWLTQVHPEIPQRLIDQARFGNEEYGSILVERITTLERTHLLSRVFSPERIALVIELLEQAGFQAE
ncbi:hypothetical protein ABIC83_002637 [Roseateles asaccharophilus]|uniref:type IVB secretion system protein IcmW n=1 Tax=Roseateles asaccharophilus TaxID=582607 RepID=UPI003833AE17